MLSDFSQFISLEEKVNTMIIEEIKKSQELSTHFSIALIESDYDLNLKVLLKQKSLNNLIARLHTISIAAKISDDPRSKELFNFLESKIKSKNKKEYVSMKHFIEEALVKQFV